MGHSEHHFEINVFWTGNRGLGTSDYKSYGRDHSVTAAGLPILLGSAARTFHGDQDRWNPELLLVAALSQCHMLSYLHVAVNHGLVITKYEDNAEGTMVLNPDGSGQFTSVTLNPRIALADPAGEALALELHKEANRKCFIARSVNFPVNHNPTLFPKNIA